MLRHASKPLCAAPKNGCCGMLRLHMLARGSPPDATETRRPGSQSLRTTNRGKRGGKGQPAPRPPNAEKISLNRANESGGMI